DPAILAIGDCAEHDEQVYGLVAPAWEQAAVAADVLCGGSARYTGSRLVTRLKASGVDLATMGDPHAVDADGTEIVTFADPARHTYQKVVIRERRVVGAILLGDNPTVGQVTQLFDRNAPVPADPRSLLLGGRGVAVGSDDTGPALGGDVCRCNGVRAGALVAAWLGGARTVDQIAAATRAGTGCGGCRTTLGRIVADMHRGLESGPAGSSSAGSSMAGSSDELEVVA
ncbi:MAG TPA: (2Fe-2S)-binding protein, partial [Actinopolymorphaceae bacterium]